MAAFAAVVIPRVIHCGIPGLDSLSHSSHHPLCRVRKVPKRQWEITDRSHPAPVHGLNGGPGPVQSVYREANRSLIGGCIRRGAQRAKIFREVCSPVINPSAWRRWWPTKRRRQAGWRALLEGYRTKPKCHCRLNREALAVASVFLFEQEGTELLQRLVSSALIPSQIASLVFGRSRLRSHIHICLQLTEPIKIVTTSQPE